MAHQSTHCWSFTSNYNFTNATGKEEAHGSVHEVKNGTVVRDAKFTAADGKMQITENGQQREEPWNGKKSLALAWTRPQLREK